MLRSRLNGAGKVLSEHYFWFSSVVLRSASRDSRIDVLKISTKLAIRNPKMPPSTAEERPPKSVPAKDEDVRRDRAIAPEIPPINPPILTDMGKSQPIRECRSRWEGGGAGTSVTDVLL